MISLDIYAQALFEVSQDRALTFYDAIVDFGMVLKDPEIRSVMERTYADTSVLDPLWDVLVYDSEVVKLLKIMQASRLMNDYPRFVDAYRTLLLDHKLLVSVEVVSAVALEDVEALKASIAKRYEGRIELVSSIDTSLIKGMVLRINHDVFDTSIKKRLDSVMKEAGR